MHYIVQYSGGIGSYGAARTLVDRHGPDAVTLLFADTLIEDADLYRFLDETVDSLGCRLIRVADGRTPWQVFRDVRFIGNTRVDPCSAVLKRDLLRRTLDAQFDPATHIIALGIDWTEEHRLVKARPHWTPWTLIAPLCEPPLHSKAHWQKELLYRGIAIPRLYSMGFPHNNCGGFCIKAGQAHFANLFKQLPERYRWHEQQEQDLRAYLGKDVAILRDRRGGKTRPMTLRTFRERVAAGDFDKHEWGGCGCALE
jgi:3'-phosphoadenosine 5'-phosphosulfate sulfotransferase (PAPS reductase)/FAD synthetase